MIIVVVAVLWFGGRCNCGGKAGDGGEACGDVMVCGGETVAGCGGMGKKWLMMVVYVKLLKCSFANYQGRSV